MKYKEFTGWILLFAILFFVLQFTQSFHFFFIEQFQLFRFSSLCFTEKVSVPGGFTYYIGEFLTQFYILPYAGAIITSSLLTVIGIICRAICKQINPVPEPVILYLLPSLGLLFISLDFNHLVQGTFSFLLGSLFLLLYVSIKKEVYRLLSGAVFLPALYWFTGPVVAPVVLFIILYELLCTGKKRFLSFLILFEYIVIILLSYRYTSIPDIFWTFLPGAYYHPSLIPPHSIYLSWLFLISIPIGMRVAPFLYKLPFLRKSALPALQIGLVGIIFVWGFNRYTDKTNSHIKILDHYGRTGQWDKIILASEGILDNYLYIAYLNRALAETGQWYDRIFHYYQKGPSGVIPYWDQTYLGSTLLSDIYFTLGMTGIAQRFAFEASVANHGSGSPRNLQRLVQTNLIFGEYKVAEKYISILEQTFGYRKWANEYRKFLYNDHLVFSDPELGWRKRILPEESHLALMENTEKELLDYTGAAVSENPAVQYVGLLFLLAKNTEGFKNLIEKYYGTPLLEQLPIPFQEAVILIEEKDQSYWSKFNISPSVMYQFENYRQTIFQNRNNPEMMHREAQNKFGKTYWYYYIYR